MTLNAFTKLLPTTMFKLKFLLNATPVKRATSRGKQTLESKSTTQPEQHTFSFAKTKAVIIHPAYQTLELFQLKRYCSSNLLIRHGVMLGGYEVFVVK